MVPGTESRKSPIIPDIEIQQVIHEEHSLSLTHYTQNKPGTGKIGTARMAQITERTELILMYGEKSFGRDVTKNFKK